MRTVVALIVFAVVLAVLAWESQRLPAAFRRDVRSEMQRSVKPAMVTEADLTPLPQAVRTFLRRAGVLNHPRVRNFHAKFTAEMRG
jgi:hypothetical protein